MLFLVYLVIFFLGDTHVKACFFKSPCPFLRVCPAPNYFHFIWFFLSDISLTYHCALHIFYSLNICLFQKQENERFLRELQESVECPVCFCVPRAPPVPCCQNGHVICSRYEKYIMNRWIQNLDNALIAKLKQLEIKYLGFKQIWYLFYNILLLLFTNFFIPF